MNAHDDDAVQAQYILDLSKEHLALLDKLGKVNADIAELEQREEDLKVEMMRIRNALKPLCQDAQDISADIDACVSKRSRAMIALNKGPVYAACGYIVRAEGLRDACEAGEDKVALRR